MSKYEAGVPLKKIGVPEYEVGVPLKKIGVPEYEAGLGIGEWRVGTRRLV